MVGPQRGCGAGDPEAARGEFVNRSGKSYEGPAGKLDLIESSNRES